MLNHIVVMGRLTRDPELRHTSSNIPVVSFTLAVDRDFTSKDTGEKATDFIDCVAWRGTGEFVSKWFTKGKMAVVSGRLQIREWKDKEGNNRRNAEIVADSVYFGESKRDGGGAAAPYGGGGAYEGGGSYGGGSGYGGGYDQGAGRSFPPPAPDLKSGFAEIEDEDELPF